MGTRPWADISPRPSTIARSTRAGNQQVIAGMHPLQPADAPQPLPQPADQTSPGPGDSIISADWRVEAAVESRAPVAANRQQSGSALLLTLPTPARAPHLQPVPADVTPSARTRGSEASPGAELTRRSGTGTWSKLVPGWLRQCGRLLMGERSITPRVRAQVPETAACLRRSPAECEREREQAQNLVIAAERGQYARVKGLIRAGARTDYCGEGGWTALLHAASRGDLAILELLLQAGAKPDQQNDAGQTALELCVLRGHVACFPPLIAAGADIATNNFGAVRRAFEARHKDALTAFGFDVLSQVYERDQMQLRTMSRQLRVASRRIASEEGKVCEDLLKAFGDAEADGRMCVICFEAVRSVLLHPCLHVVLCSKCAANCKECPICRRPVQQNTSVFLS